MKIVTGIISDGGIVVNERVSLPNRTRVRVYVETIGPAAPEGVEIEFSQEEIDFARQSRERIGKAIEPEGT